ncbi:MAG: M20/M25/M40 family metallo-hydrolase [Bacteroidales bacterium]|nr:M20/M25/M40 family metallo-hydrolase [Bacteroidales bacterium]
MHLLKILFSVSVLLLLNSIAFSQNIEISSDDIETHVSTLASEQYGGRFPGSTGDSLSANYIVNEMKANGADEVILQDFKISIGVKAGVNIMTINDADLIFGKDFSVYGYSASTHLSTSLVFVGKQHVFTAADSLAIKSKWVITPRASQMTANGDTDRDKAQMLADAGAAGVIFVSILPDFSQDNLVVANENLGKMTIPVFHISRETSAKLFQLVQSDNDFLNSDKIAFSDNIITAKTEILQVEVITHNIIGIVKTKNKSKLDELIFIGAHYDHLGLGGNGSSSRRQDTVAVHFGADDNASGVAVLLELIEATSKNSEKLNRDIVFVAFGAEERGLLGSEFYVKSYEEQISKATAMINLDMLGRLKTDKSLQIGGVGTSIQSDSILNAINKNYGFKLVLSPEGYGPSDHASFYAKNVPVFFISTGAHSDYHTPSDSPEKLNYTAMSDITAYTYDLILGIDNLKNRLSFQESGPKNSTEARHGGKRKVSFGLMPDFAATDIAGLRADVVSPGKPAALAGMQNGDIIKSINGNPVNDIQEYMYRLGQLNPGEQVIVDVDRNGEMIVLIIQL